ncbi:MAG: hypothetical protein JST28_04290 [Acidobacteria bacterium]|nr:hypothetical protein [Acidobacteriota bacterium]
MTRVIEGNILEQIRQRPLMFLGERSLSYLYHFIHGYSMHRDQPLELLPADFHEWVAYRLHYLEPTSGYRNMILNRFPNEEEAFNQFFELLDQHRARRATSVAKVRAHPLQPEIFKGMPGTEEQTRVRVAREVSLVVYTDDPGLFVTHDDPGAEYPARRVEFRPSLSWLETPYKPVPEYVTVFDKLVFSRLVREAEAFDREFQARRKTLGGDS